MGKRTAMKNFFQSLCADSELVSTLTMDLKETVYLDKRVLNDQRKFVDCCLGSDSPFQRQKYTLFTWKVKGCWGLPKEKRPRDMKEGDWTHVKIDGWTDNFTKYTNKLLHVNYDVVGCMGTKEYLYMRRPLPCFERLLPLVGAVDETVNDCNDDDDNC